MRPRDLKMIVWIGFFIFALTSIAWSQNPMKVKTGKKQADANAAENIALPEPLDAEKIDQIIAGLSDEQVRRLLIDELKAQAQQEAQTTPAEPKPEGIAGFIHKIKNLTILLQTRIEFLRSGGSGAPQEVSGVVAFLARGERGTKSLAAVILSVGAVLAGALLIEWLFMLYRAKARSSIGSTVPAGWSAKIGVISMRALLDLAAIIIFVIAALVLFFLFLDRTPGQRVLLAGYLAAFVIVQGAFLLSRAFLSPRWPALRLLPFSDETALYLHRWIMALTAVVAFGYVTNGVMRLAGASELKYFQATVLVTLIIAIMLIWMILQKRQAAAATFSRNLPESSLRYRLARNWHHFAVLGVVLLLAFSIVNRIMGSASGQGILTMLMVPLYFLLDWILRLILEAAFGLVAQPKVQTVATAAASSGPADGEVAEIIPPSAAKLLRANRPRAAAWNSTG
jgi:moderate conductance mechanosensitive channel